MSLFNCCFSKSSEDKSDLKNWLSVGQKRVCGYLEKLEMYQKTVHDKMPNYSEAFPLKGITDLAEPMMALLQAWRGNSFSDDPTIEFVTEKWIDIVYPYALACRSSDPESYAMCVNVGQGLATIAFFEGEIDRAVVVLACLFQLNDRDVVVASLLLRWAAHCRVVDLIGDMIKSSRIDPHIEVLFTACVLHSEFFHADCDTERDRSRHEMRKMLEDLKDTTAFTAYYCRILIHEVLQYECSMATAVQQDSVPAILRAQELFEVCRDTGMDKIKYFFFEFEIPLKDFDRQKPNYIDLLCQAAGFFEYFDGTEKYTWTLMEHLLTTEAVNYSILALCTAMSVSTPGYVVRALNVMLAQRVFVVDDNYMALFARAMLAQALTDCREGTYLGPECDAYYERRRDDQDFTIFKTSEIFFRDRRQVVPHTCRHCFICISAMNTSALRTEMEMALFLLHRVMAPTTQALYVPHFGAAKTRIVAHMDAILTAVDAKDFPKPLVLRMSRMHYYAAIVLSFEHFATSCVRRLEDFDPVLHGQTLECLTEDFIELRGYWLFSRQLQRLDFDREAAYPWLVKNKDGLDTSRATLPVDDSNLPAIISLALDIPMSKKASQRFLDKETLRDVDEEAADREDVLAAAKKFASTPLMAARSIATAIWDRELYTGIVFPLWRFAVCSYLGAALAESNPQEAAFFFSDFIGCALSNAFVLRKKGTALSPLKNAAELFLYMNNFVPDITTLELFVDAANVLWLVRIQKTQPCIVIPLTVLGHPKKSLSEDPLLLDYWQLVKENFTSSSSGSKENFYGVRRSLNVRFEEFMRSLSKHWFGAFDNFCKPFCPKFQPEIVQKTTDFLVQTFEIHEGFAKVIAALPTICSPRVFKRLIEGCQHLSLLLSNPSLAAREKAIEKIDYDSGHKAYMQIVKEMDTATAPRGVWVILVLCYEVQSMPFEALPAFSGFPLITRANSLHELIREAIAAKWFAIKKDPKKIYCIVDPSNDLAETQKRISGLMQLTNENSVIGQWPSSQIIQNRFNNSDIILYAGHGGGLPSTAVAAVEGAICLMYGCGSAGSFSYGRGRDGRSVFREYTLSKCMGYLGSLWAVTDREIDRCMIHLVHQSFKNFLSSDFDKKLCQIDPTFPAQKLTGETVGSLSRAIHASRDICMFRFLTGYSLVYYGLPCYLDTTGDCGLLSCGPEIECNSSLTDEHLEIDDNTSEQLTIVDDDIVDHFFEHPQPGKDPEKPRTGTKRRIAPDEPICKYSKSTANVHPSFDRVFECDPKENEFNVLLIGPSGAGKSTLINSMVNYFKYDKLADAAGQELLSVLPCKFDVQDEDYNFYQIAFGEDGNECFNDLGQSVTQLPQVHQLQHGAVTFNLIDTPGLRDSRGVDQDEKNLEAIREAVRRAGTLHAICFVLLPNEAKMGAGLELVFRKLLSLFSVDAFPNVCFFFTNSCGTLFRPGDSIQPIKRLRAAIKDELGADLPFGKENVFCVDSDAFRYLVVKQKAPGIDYSSFKTVEYNWSKSSESVRNFVRFVLERKPFQSQLGQLTLCRQTV